MTTFLIFFGILLLAICPMYCALYMQAKDRDVDRTKMVLFLAFIPGVLILALAVYLKDDHVLETSRACGVVKFYKTYQLKRDHFERIAIQFDGSKYNRHLRFEENLQKKSKGEYVCFEYWDKYKYTELGESKIIKWMN